MAQNLQRTIAPALDLSRKRWRIYYCGFALASPRSSLHRHLPFLDHIPLTAHQASATKHASLGFPAPFKISQCSQRSLFVIR